MHILLCYLLTFSHRLPTPTVSHRLSTFKPYNAVPFTEVHIPPPSEVQALCSVVVWESPGAPHCNNLIGYDVRLFGSPQLQQNLTKRVRSNRTYYVISDEDNLANSSETHVQVPTCMI